MLHPRTAHVLLYAVIIGLATMPESVADDPPAIALISASLMQQRAQPVEVCYALSRVSADHASDVEDGTVTRYVRTPEATYDPPPS